MNLITTVLLKCEELSNYKTVSISEAVILEKIQDIFAIVDYRIFCDLWLMFYPTLKETAVAT